MRQPRSDTPGWTVREANARARRKPGLRQLAAVARPPEARRPSTASLVRRIIDSSLDEARGVSRPLEVELDSWDGSEEARFDIYSLVAHHGRLLDQPPSEAIEIQLRVLVAFGPVSHASLWISHAPGRLTCAAAAGSHGATRAVRRAAADVFQRTPSRTLGHRALVRALPVRVGNSAETAALVYRALPGAQEWAARYAEEATLPLSHVLDRRLLVEGLEARERLLQGLERRTARQRYELHDGALQRLSTLIAGVSYLRRQVGVLAERLAESEDLAYATDHELREVIRALPPTSTRRSLESSIRSELRALTATSGIAADFRSEGAASSATAAQRFTAASVVKEALANVRQHSEATRVDVVVAYGEESLTLTITDDGRGFSPGVARSAERSGRLGLMSMRDRVRLAGGDCEIQSRSGGPTVVFAVIPRPQPLDAAETLGETDYRAAGDAG
jgi:signal transduction histidine kinase